MSSKRHRSPSLTPTTHKTESYLGYSNGSNPFQDPQLKSVFVWGKKRDAMGKRETEEQVRNRQKLAHVEILKAKRAREDKEREKELMREWKEKQQRDAAREEASELDAKEEEFHRTQAKIKSELRIASGREKAVDIFAKNLYFYLDKKTLDPLSAVALDIDITEPYALFESTKDVSVLESLREDIGYLLGLGVNREYWQALLLMCDDALSVAREKPNPNSFLSVAMKKDIKTLFLSKSSRELRKIRSAIQTQLDRMTSGRENVAASDVEFFEYLLGKISVYEARNFLTDFHIQVLKKRLAQLLSSDAVNDVPVPIFDPDEEEKRLVMQLQETAASFEKFDEASLTDDIFEDLSLESCTKMGVEAAQVNYSPPLVPRSSVDSKLSLVDETEDLRLLLADRLKILDMIENQLITTGELTAKDWSKEVLVTESSKLPTMSRLLTLSNLKNEANNVVQNATVDYARSLEDQMVQHEAMYGMEEGETGFGVEANVNERSYLWQDKYRPRKPRFFNRVKTGFEWNKYNATHYDHDHPPPKHVMGYKFNIFYPDLIDPTKIPFYILENAESPDFCIIRFTAGPPYEDIAFKIVNREWDFDAARANFKCSFDRGVFQLWFNFRKHRWRR